MANRKSAIRQLMMAAQLNDSRSGMTIDILEPVASNPFCRGLRIEGR